MALLWQPIIHLEIGRKCVRSAVCNFEKKIMHDAIAKYGAFFFYSSSEFFSHWHPWDGQYECARLAIYANSIKTPANRKCSIKCAHGARAVFLFCHRSGNMEFMLKYLLCEIWAAKMDDTIDSGEKSNVTTIQQLHRIIEIKLSWLNELTTSNNSIWNRSHGIFNERVWERVLPSAGHYIGPNPADKVISCWGFALCFLLLFSSHKLFWPSPPGACGFL